MKKYCFSCGELNPTRRRFCPNCGADTKNSVESTQKAYEKPETPQIDSVQQYKSKDPIQFSDVPERKPFLGLWFFILLIPGLGQIFAGKRRKGLIFMISAFFLLIVSLVTSFWPLNYMVAMLFIWGIVDGIIQLRKYNMYINRQSQEPSQNMKKKDFLKEKSVNGSQTPNSYNKIPINSVLWLMLFIPGWGQIIAGKKKSGFRFMVITLTLICLAIIIPLATPIYQTIYFLNPIVAILYIWGIVDGIIQLRKYNRYMNRHNQEPSQTMKLKDLLSYRKATR